MVQCEKNGADVSRAAAPSQIAYDCVNVDRPVTVMLKVLVTF